MQFIEGTFFDRVDITDIDLNGKELKNADLFDVIIDVIIKDKKLDSGVIEEIKAGNLKNILIKRNNLKRAQKLIISS